MIAGKYRLEQELGRGGMGAVYAARHVLTGRAFAVKLLGRELRGDARAEARFLREATLASSIQHPAIVEVYDVGCDRGQPYMVMKLLRGETLSRRLERGALPPGEAIALLLPVVDAVAAAHACGIVHRDLKPDNVMIERDGDRDLPRVLDFGISKAINAAEPRARITHPGVLIGTPDYMAPEQIRGEPGLDARTDIYALGVMLYEMLTGTVPYQAEECPELLRKIVGGGAPGIRAHGPELAPELEAVVARAMALRPEQRHADATALARDLARFAPVAAPPITAAARGTPDSITPLTTTLARRPTLPPRAGFYAALAVAALGASGALAAAGWRAAHGGREATAPGHGAAQPGALPAGGAAASATAAPLSAPEPPLAAMGLRPPEQPLTAVHAAALPAASTPALRAASAPTRARADRRPRRPRRAIDAPPDLAEDRPLPQAIAATPLPSVTSELLDPFQ